MNQNSNTTLQQYMQQSEQAVAMNTGMLVLLIILSVAYLVTIIYTLNHCLHYCYPEDKTPYTLTILLFPIAGIVFYWLHGPYEPVKVKADSPFHHEPAPADEMPKPGATTPAGRVPTATPDTPIKIPKAMTASQPMPRPAKPIHIIAEERRATITPFPPL
jgi:hypothetical protein